MRLDHLLSKESFSRPFRSRTPSRSLVIRRSCILGGSPRPIRFPLGERPGPAPYSEGVWSSDFHCSVLRERLCFVAASVKSTALLLVDHSRTSSGRHLQQRQRAPLENSIASTSIFVLQATKSQRWMPWRLKPKKDVGGCEKPRGVADQTSIRGCPNGETRHPSWGVTPV